MVAAATEMEPKMEGGGSLQPITLPQARGPASKRSCIRAAMPPDALCAPLLHSCHKRYPGMQGSPLSPERWVSTRMMMSASPFDARRADKAAAAVPEQDPGTSLAEGEVAARRPAGLAAAHRRQCRQLRAAPGCC